MHDSAWRESLKIVVEFKHPLQQSARTRQLFDF